MQGLCTAEIPQTDEWTEIRIEGIPVTSGKMHLEIYSDAAAGEYIYFDDFNIEMSKDMDAIASMVESVLGEMLLDNNITEETLLAEVEDILDSYDGMTASITDFQKTEATDDTEGSISGTIVLKNSSGDTKEVPFNLSIPRTSLVYNASFELSTYNGSSQRDGKFGIGPVEVAISMWKVNQTWAELTAATGMECTGAAMAMTAVPTRS